LLAKTQPEKNSASRISAEKICQPEFDHKKFGSEVQCEMAKVAIDH